MRWKTLFFFAIMLLPVAFEAGAQSLPVTANAAAKAAEAALTEKHSAAALVVPSLRAELAKK